MARTSDRGAQAALQALLIVSGLSTAAFSAVFTYIGIWALRALHASSAELTVLLVLNAVGATLGGLNGGRLADRAGSRRVTAIAWTAQSLLIASFALLAGFWTALPLVAVMSTVGASGSAALSAVVPALVAPDRLHDAFARQRIAINVGALCGPPLAALLVTVTGWSGLFACAAAIGLVSAAVAAARLPGGRATEDASHGGQTGCGGVALLSLPRFRLLIASSLLAFLVYTIVESVIPIVAVSHLGVSSHIWGLVIASNPLIVVLFQLPVANAVKHYPGGTRAAIGILLMGLPFILLAFVKGVLTLCAAVAVFAFGEMVWAPAAQTAVAENAGPDALGAGLGLFNSTGSVAYAVAPPLALGLVGATGVAGLWLLLVALAACGAALAWVTQAASAPPPGA